MAYLVDKDILVDYLRHQEAAADYLDSLGEWSLSVVSGMELVAGALNSDEVREIDTVLATLIGAVLKRSFNHRRSLCTDRYSRT